MHQPTVDIDEEEATEVAEKRDRGPMVEIADDPEARKQLRTMASWWDVNQPLALARAIKLALNEVKKEIGDVDEFEATLGDDPADQ